MRKKISLFLTVIGAVLLLGTLLLILYNYLDARRATRDAESLSAALEIAIERRRTETEEPSDTTDPQDSPGAQSERLPVADVDGYGCVGFIGIPRLDLKLPIMSEWDYDRLRIAPCRQFGYTREDDLVIAGHNYKGHFGRLKELECGDAVVFTDMDGNVRTFAVSLTEILAPGDLDYVRNCGHALVLYTCTSDGGARFAVFCDEE